MKNVVYLLIVFALGAVVALLFAPESGKDLRTNIRGTGEADWHKMQSDWQNAMQETNQRVATLQAEVQQKRHPQSPTDDTKSAESSDATS